MTDHKLTTAKVVMDEDLGVNILVFLPVMYLVEFLKLYLHEGRAVKWGRFQFCRVSWG